MMSVRLSRTECALKAQVLIYLPVILTFGVGETSNIATEVTEFIVHPDIQQISLWPSRYTKDSLDEKKSVQKYS